MSSLDPDATESALPAPAPQPPAPSRVSKLSKEEKTERRVKRLKDVHRAQRERNLERRAEHSFARDFLSDLSKRATSEAAAVKWLAECFDDLDSKEEHPQPRKSSGLDLELFILGAPTKVARSTFLKLRRRETPILRAIFRDLESRGGNLFTTPSSEGGKSPFYWAMLAGNINMACALVDLGARIELPPEIKIDAYTGMAIGMLRHPIMHRVKRRLEASRQAQIEGGWQVLHGVPPLSRRAARHLAGICMANYLQISVGGAR